MIKLLKFFLKPFYLYFTDSKSRRLIHLKAKYYKLKKYQSKSIRFENYHITVPDVPSFLDQYENIFYHEAYAFSSDQIAPLIYDCGANIGMGILYWKKHFPESTIVAFEADPTFIEVLGKNLQSNLIKGVTLIDKAVWIDDHGVNFHQEGGQGGAILSSETKGIKLPSIRFKRMLQDENRVIDFLKIDIEGAEYAVLQDCEEELRKVKNLFIEVHFSNTSTAKFSSIIQILEKQEFSYFIQNEIISKPFLNHLSDKKPFSIEIFATRL